MRDPRYDALLPDAADLTLAEIAAGGMFDGPEPRWQPVEIVSDPPRLEGNRRDRRAAAAKTRKAR